MTRLITMTLLLLTLFMAGTAAMGSGAPTALALCEVGTDQGADPARLDEEARAANDGDQDPSAGADHTDCVA